MIDPTTSDEAKAHAREVLEKAGALPDTNDDEHEKRVLAGYKAALHSAYGRVMQNPNVSEEAKENAQKVLQEHDAL
ncbi:hypothetical protein VNI00_006453 [Paramarasmius palmivorus]|uniref:Uncharacterized protein n=1 Tax=Paramarasmius palmivorus TaxID=297713 RepID=A0AAW0D5D2_9AGAR